MSVYIETCFFSLLSFIPTLGKSLSSMSEVERLKQRADLYAEKVRSATLKADEKLMSTYKDIYTVVLESLTELGESYDPLNRPEKAPETKPSAEKTPSNSTAVNDLKGNVAPLATPPQSYSTHSPLQSYASGSSPTGAVAGYPQMTPEQYYAYQQQYHYAMSQQSYHAGYSGYAPAGAGYQQPLHAGYAGHQPYGQGYGSSYRPLYQGTPIVVGGRPAPLVASTTNSPPQPSTAGTAPASTTPKSAGFRPFVKPEEVQRKAEADAVGDGWESGPVENRIMVTVPSKLGSAPPKSQWQTKLCELSGFAVVLKPGSSDEVANWLAWSPYQWPILIQDRTLTEKDLTRLCEATWRSQADKNRKAIPRSNYDDLRNGIHVLAITMNYAPKDLAINDLSYIVNAIKATLVRISHFCFAQYQTDELPARDNVAQGKSPLVPWLLHYFTQYYARQQRHSGGTNGGAPPPPSYIPPPSYAPPQLPVSGSPNTNPAKVDAPQRPAVADVFSRPLEPMPLEAQPIPLGDNTGVPSALPSGAPLGTWEKKVISLTAKEKKKKEKRDKDKDRRRRRSESRSRSRSRSRSPLDSKRRRRERSRSYDRDDRRRK